jgi:hypothetical protein
MSDDDVVRTDPVKTVRPADTLPETTKEVLFSEGKSMTFLPTNISTELPVGGMPSATPQPIPQAPEPADATPPGPPDPPPSGSTPPSSSDG